ncbi:MAG: hypothetical protein IH602_11335 [Bryobacteraceae bacterium]|nr:hypothetical protein [Bryobacteraceae bacterium]
MAYLQTDEELEVAHAMAMAANFARGVESDPHLWRWIILALHSAAQGAMVLSIRHGNGLLALSRTSYAEWMAAYEKNEPPPRERLDNSLDLYEKVKHRTTGTIGGNTRFVPRGFEGADIKRLNSLRNEFIHFTPRGWSLEIDGLPRICLSAGRLVSFLAIETTNVMWRDEDAHNMLKSVHGQFTSEMERLKVLFAKRRGQRRASPRSLVSPG